MASGYDLAILELTALIDQPNTAHPMASGYDLAILELTALIDSLVIDVDPDTIEELYSGLERWGPMFAEFDEEFFAYTPRPELAHVNPPEMINVDPDAAEVFEDEQYDDEMEMFYHMWNQTPIRTPLDLLMFQERWLAMIHTTEDVEVRIATEDEDTCCVCLENYPNATFVGCLQTNTICCLCAETVLARGMRCPHCRAEVNEYVAGPL
jgi:hypothetical protein